MSISARIKKRREQLRMTQAQLARVVGVTQTAISQFESGTRKPSFDTLPRLTDALGITSDYLLRGRKAYDCKDILADPKVSIILKGFMELSEKDKEEMFRLYEFLRSKKL